MRKSWATSLIRLAGLLLLGAFLGLYFGSISAGLLCAALVALGYYLYNLLRLEQELSLRQRVTVPDGSGLWADVLARIDYLNLRIRRNKKKYRGLLKELRDSTNAMTDGVVTLTSDFEIIRYNRAAQQLLGLRRRRDRGQRVENLLRHPEFVAYLASRDFVEPVIVPAPVRHDSWLQVHVIPYGAGSWLLLIRDVTEQTRLAQMRRDFVANASHELRTPLTVLNGYLEAMVDDPEIPEVWRKPVEIMYRQAHRMHEIVTDLLELSTLENAQGDAESMPLAMGEIISAAIASLPVQDDIAAIQVSVESRARLIGNRSALLSVATNLLQNARRHTPAGGDISIEWRDNEDGGASLSVLDTGEGIANAHLPRLTERFFRVDRGRGRTNGGSGLGLAIVKHVLSQHGGHLEIESRLGEGSAFHCVFPAGKLAREPVDSVTGL